jgi:hypothetical protein
MLARPPEIHQPMNAKKRANKIKKKGKTYSSASSDNNRPVAGLTMWTF